MAMSRKAILDGKRVVPCDDILRWAAWFESSERVVACTEFEGGVVSTVFLGVNHGWNDKEEWFETMVFGGPMDGHQERYATWEEAEAGHKAILAKVLA